MTNVSNIVCVAIDSENTAFMWDGEKVYTQKGINAPKTINATCKQKEDAAIWCSDNYDFSQDENTVFDNW